MFVRTPPQVDWLSQIWMPSSGETCSRMTGLLWIGTRQWPPNADQRRVLELIPWPMRDRGACVSPAQMKMCELQQNPHDTKRCSGRNRAQHTAQGLQA